MEAERVLHLLVAPALVLVAALVVGPRRGAELARGGLRALEPASGAAIAALVALPMLAVLAAPYVSVPRTLAVQATGALGTLALIAIFLRFPGAAGRLAELPSRIPGALSAAILLVAALAAGLFLYQDMPRIADEAAYRFQAFALAQGRLWLEPPPIPEFFEGVHTTVDGGKWYGIMNPGWPALLALAERAGVPWLAAPLLGALGILCLHRFFLRAGFGRSESRTATLLLAISPFLVFLCASYLAHAASFFCFALFALACARLRESARWSDAAVAGFALGLGLLVRPVDAVLASLPLLLPLLPKLRSSPGFLSRFLSVGAIAAAFAGLVLLYNRELTGDAFLAPMEKYFRDRELGTFGIGFGPEMGTQLHGPEWPGYYPSDALRVSSYRLVELLQDFGGASLALLVAVLAAFRRCPSPLRSFEGALAVSAGALVGIYALHFYHGIAYGARHLFLTAPFLALAIARPLVRAGAPVAAAPGLFPGRAARATLAALLLQVPLLGYPDLVRRYGADYRMATPILRDTAAALGLEGALVFVDGSRWGWKSAFPLNRYPLEASPVVYARDLGSENGSLLARFPGRRAYSCSLLPPPERIRLVPYDAPPVSR